MQYHNRHRPAGNALEPAIWAETAVGRAEQLWQSDSWLSPRVTGKVGLMKPFMIIKVVNML
jgi:hypothetical protein